MFRRSLLAVLSVMLLAACTGPELADYRGQQPELLLEEFFEGRTRAYGVFEKRGGEIARRFTVEIQGIWDQESETLTLKEDFQYADGETDERVWTIKKTGPDSYVGTAPDVKGEARGEAAGNALTWSYLLEFERDNGDTVNLKLKDWLVLIDKDHLYNTARVSKFGITLGHLRIFFQKLPVSGDKPSGDMKK